MAFPRKIVNGGIVACQVCVLGKKAFSVAHARFTRFGGCFDDFYCWFISWFVNEIYYHVVIGSGRFTGAIHNEYILENSRRASGSWCVHFLRVQFSAVLVLRTWYWAGLVRFVLVGEEITWCLFLVRIIGSSNCLYYITKTGIHY